MSGHQLEHECQICARTSQDSAACPGCRALFYCSDKHRQAHLSFGHAEECARMAGQMQRAQELATFPFPWAKQLMASDSQAAFCHLLQSLSCHRMGLWQRDCDCESEPGTDHQCGKLGGQMLRECRDNNAYVAALPRHLMPCQLSQAHSMLHPADWAAYYRLRGLPLDSPAALLLHVPLTLYHAMREAASSAPERFDLEGRGRLVVHIVGAQHELDQWPVLLELAALLPDLEMVLALVSPWVPEGLDQQGSLFASPRRPSCGVAGCSCEHALPQDGISAEPGQGSLYVTFMRGLHHEVSSRLQALHGPPDVIFGPNAGLAAHPDWVPTLQALAQLEELGGGGVVEEDRDGKEETSHAKVPLCIFTDFCEEAALRAEQMAACLAPGLQPVMPVQLNPFRQPLRRWQPDNALPSCSNGFVFVFAGAAAP